MGNWLFQITTFRQRAINKWLLQMTNFRSMPIIAYNMKQI